jgi:hypothetical protein
MTKTKTKSADLKIITKINARPKKNKVVESNAAEDAAEESAIFIEQQIPHKADKVANNPLISEDEGVMLYDNDNLFIEDVNYVNDNNVSLYIECLADSGTTSHIFKDFNAFSDYTLVHNIMIGGVGSTKTRAIGRGTVILIADTEAGKCKIKLHNTLHVPECKYNLISLGRWEDAGRSYQAINGTLTLYTSKGSPVVKGQRG